MNVDKEKAKLIEREFRNKMIICWDERGVIWDIRDQVITAPEIISVLAFVIDKVARECVKT